MTLTEHLKLDSRYIGDSVHVHVDEDAHICIEVLDRVVVRLDGHESWRLAKYIAKHLGLALRGLKQGE